MSRKEHDRISGCLLGWPRWRPDAKVGKTDRAGRAFEFRAQGQGQQGSLQREIGAAWPHVGVPTLIVGPEDLTQEAPPWPEHPKTRRREEDFLCALGPVLTGRAPGPAGPSREFRTIQFPPAKPRPSSETRRGGKGKQFQGLQQLGRIFRVAPLSLSLSASLSPRR